MLCNLLKRTENEKVKDVAQCTAPGCPVVRHDVVTISSSFDHMLLQTVQDGLEQAAIEQADTVIRAARSSWHRVAAARCLPSRPTVTKPFDVSPYMRDDANMQPALI